jgi:hypothetical protein
MPNVEWRMTNDGNRFAQPVLASGIPKSEVREQISEDRE